jgi:hypothetical protein
MADLKLGRLPKVGRVHMTIGIPEPLKEERDRYAAQHSRLYEPVDAATLIPHNARSLHPVGPRLPEPARSIRARKSSSTPR